MTNIIEKINNPKDLKTLSITELKILAQEMRELIITKVNSTGGHMGPNLGIVEKTIALQYVFDSPKDKIVYDVSHQCYPHKILTGRKDGYTDEKNYLKYSGFTNPKESEHDIFVVGHTSTSVSLATGLAKGRDLTNCTENIIALIGDGSLSGGEAYEGLNNAAELNSNIIIIVNDNDMSIAENQGGLYKNLKQLRDSDGKAECNFFKAMGFDYKYIDDGNDIEKMIHALQEIKDINHPIVLHIKTLKGKGLKVAEENKEAFHWILPHTLDKKDDCIKTTETYDTITTDFLIKQKENGLPVLAITPATPGATGFSKDFREKMGKHYCDTGIAEEHTMAFCAGMAKNGARPVLSILSSFVQRTYDQLSQDIGLNNSPVTVLVNWGAISGADMTHLGSFDIPLISNIPNLVYLAPINKEEYLSMLNYSLTQKEHPVFIRVPFGAPISCHKEDETDYSILNKYAVTENGSKIAILGVGNFFELGKKIKKQLQETLNINATLIIA